MTMLINRTRAVATVARRWLWFTKSSLVALVLLTPIATAQQIEAFTEPLRIVSVPAAEIGVIAKILVHEGDRVTEKQVLAKLDDSILQASLNVARAAKDAIGSKQSAETELALREKQLEIYRQMQNQGNATSREVDRAEADYQQAGDRLQSVRESLEIRRLEYERVKAQIRHRVIESPDTGVVVSIRKEVGEFVSPTDPVILQIVHLQTLKAIFSVPIESVKSIYTGDRVELTVGSDFEVVEGTVSYVSPVADAESETVRVKVRIPNPERELAVGVVSRWNLDFESASQRTAGRVRNPTSTH